MYEDNLKLKHILAKLKESDVVDSRIMTITIDIEDVGGIRGTITQATYWMHEQGVAYANIHTLRVVYDTINNVYIITLLGR